MAVAKVARAGSSSIARRSHGSRPSSSAMSQIVVHPVRTDRTKGVHHETGVYFHGDDLYRVGIVVADELPRDRSTLLVRVMAAGKGLADAIADLAALPADAIERVVAEDILVHLQHRLGK